MFDPTSLQATLGNIFGIVLTIGKAVAVVATVYIGFKYVFSGAEGKSNLKEKDGVEKVTTAFSGRILNVIITVKEDMTVDNVKSFPDEVDKALDEKQKKAYDVQVFIKKIKDDDKFPVIAYRHQGGDHYSFTKDR